MEIEHGEFAHFTHNSIFNLLRLGCRSVSYSTSQVESVLLRFMGTLNWACLF